MDKQLLEKYNVPVPRYTSYPPANHFHDFDAAHHVEAVDASNDAVNNLVSFYLHIPFCRHLCHYCGCNSYPMMKDEMVERYVAALHKEIDLVAAHIRKDRRIAQIHYGGGSPTAIPVRHIRALNEHLLSLLPTIDRPEIAIECHPGYLTATDWEQLVGCGFSRFSIGVQDFDEKVLQTVNRRPPLVPVNDILDIVRGAGAAVNMDFLFGLPHQTPASFQRTIEKAADLHPERLVTFSYGHVPWVHKRQLFLEQAGLPSDSDKQAMFGRAAETLRRAGYRGIGMDHFVLPDDELSIALDTKRLHRNFQGYCTLRTTGQVYAFGVTAISQLESAYAQNGKDIAAYIDALESDNLYVSRGYALSRQEQIVREVIESMMCNYHIDWNETAERLKIGVGDVKAAINNCAGTLEEMQQDGLIHLTDHSISMTSAGSPFVRNVVAALDPLMVHSTKKYSKPL
ncbi:MAG: oxygen-independent coproporphyrinogen III oxidase [Prevotellaceae bacterium]|nr:oxygen-independent coproporphyrinogen III oxidase [Prevotella sp.]MDD7257923.1 oxygen-independent coproporphyrinogen III oxidase [Prevotellaceae bacterium]MDY6129684.1 oxygen-independent coproporphyrinogen III oxidase [Prevotella sp.]